MGSNEIRMIAVGDIILGRDCDYLFDHARELLKAADLTVGQLENPYTDRDENAVALGRSPSSMQPLIHAGFDVLTLAGNHLADSGNAGIEDTIRWLDEHGIAHVGAGMNLEEARRPLIVERKGTRFGFLNYNCVGPKETYAGYSKPGNAYVDVITHYELDHANPGGQPKIYTSPEFRSFQRMKEDIAALRPNCDVLIVALHKGVVHTPAEVKEYERQIAYAAIDGGADLILSHHAHILRGIEVYRGKAIFHGLCNGFVFLPVKAFSTGPMPEDWARRRKAMFGFEPDPEYVTYPFHPEAKYTIFADVTFRDGKVEQVGFIPCWVNKTGQPELVGRSDKGEEVMAYMRKITDIAGLNGRYEWEGDRIIVQIDETDD